MGKNESTSAIKYAVALGMIALVCSGFAFAKPLQNGKATPAQSKDKIGQYAAGNQQPMNSRMNVSQAVAGLRNGMTKLYVYDFSASWCPNCTAIKPMMHDLSNRYRDRVQLVEIDTEDSKNDQLVEQFGVQKLPTIVVIRPNGTIAARYVGRDEAQKLDAELSNEVSKLNAVAGPQAANKGIQSY